MFVLHLDTAGAVDLTMFLLLNKGRIDEIINNVVRQHRNVKVQLSAKVLLHKPAVAGEEENGDVWEEQPRQIQSMFTNSSFVPVYATPVLSEETFLQMVDEMVCRLNIWCSQGSGWIVDSVEHVDINFAKTLSPPAGGTYLPLPEELEPIKHLILNVRSDQDNNCFAYCVIASCNPEIRFNRTRPSTYYPYLDRGEIVGNYEAPMPLHSIPRFESANNVSICVYIFENGSLVPAYVTKNVQCERAVDLLLLSDGMRYHYAHIINLSALLKHLGTSNRTRARAYACRRCLHLSWRQESAETHRRDCFLSDNADSLQITMPKPGTMLSFTDFRSRARLPIIVVFDLEAIAKPMDTCLNVPTISSTTRVEQQECCSYCFAIIEVGNEKPLRVVLRREKDCLNQFLREMRELALEVYKINQRHRLFTGNPPDSALFSVCWICERPFNADDEKVLDHCHYSGDFLGFAHSQCNVNRKVSNFVPVIAHNLSGYDLHHICQYLSAIDKADRISVIPSTDETYISLNIAVKVSEYFDTTRRKMCNVYQNLRFLDSFRFMTASLQTLVEYLPPSKFSLIENYFKASGKEAFMIPSNLMLLKKKGVYPYSYIDSFDKFNEQKLPPFELWHDRLTSSISVTSDQYRHAETVFETFGCKSIGDFHDLYLLSDTLLLACVFEEFRNVCYDVYGLDPAYYFSASNLSLQAFLKTTNAKVELLSERDHLSMVEKMTRGGISSIYQSRLVTANNRYCPDYDENKDTTYLLFLDANSLYGTVMEQFCLPVGDFQFVEKSLDDILGTPDDSEFGYLVECELYTRRAFTIAMRTSPCAQPRNQ